VASEPSWRAARARCRWHRAWSCTTRHRAAAAVRAPAGARCHGPAGAPVRGGGECGGVAMARQRAGQRRPPGGGAHVAAADAQHGLARRGGSRVRGAALRWASGLKGGGVLTFAPALLLDSYGAIETDLSGSRHFNGKKFLVSQARSQSGNAVGFVGGMGAAVLAGFFVAGAPVVLAALAGGIFCQVIWNWTGAADAAAGATERALR
jgi:hypothetical protein